MGNVVKIENQNRTQSNERQTRQWLKGYAKKYWRGIALVTFFSIIKIGFQLLNPWPTKILIDSVFGSVPAPGPLASIDSPERLLFILAISLVGIYLLQNTFAIVDAYYSAKLALKFDVDVKTSTFKRLMNFSLTALNKQKLGDYLFRLNNETESVKNIVIDINRSLLESGIMIIGALIILVRLNWQLAVLAVSIVPFLFVTVRYFSKRIETVSTEVEVNAAAVYSHTANSVQNIRTIQSFDQEVRQTNILYWLLVARFRIGLRSMLLHGKFGLTNDMLTTLALASIILLGGLSVLHGKLTVGELIIFMTYVSYLFGPLESINSNLGRIREYMAAAKRVFQIAESPEYVKEIAIPLPLDVAQGHIQLVDVSFTYETGSPVLQHINLTVNPGQKVLFIGPSGAGKSSLLNLLPRFYDVSEGAAYLDGHELRTLRLKDLRRQFSIVSQEPMLLLGTVGENIAFGSNNPALKADYIEVRAAAEAAGAHEFISKLPDGYNTVIGEDGLQLSGGQKQRIAIARAFLKNAPILLLDEPTSALDPDAEQSIMHSLQKLMAKRTTLIVTHREALLQQADQVYLVKDGQLTAIEDPKAYLAARPAQSSANESAESLYTQLYHQ